MKSKRRSGARGRTVYCGNYSYLYTFRVITLEGEERQLELADGSIHYYEIRAKDKMVVSYLGDNANKLIAVNLTVDKKRKLACCDKDFLEYSKAILKKLKPVDGVSS